MATYLTLAGFKSLTVMPSVFVDEIEADQAGWVDAQLEYWARWIDARLRKRYASPFAAWDDSPPTPLSVQGWLARIVTQKAWLRRGVDSGDEQFDLVTLDMTEAKAEVLEAANSEDGWFDLPVRTDNDASGIGRGDPLGYSEQSPYVWSDGQALAGREEDRAGVGS